MFHLEHADPGSWIGSTDRMTRKPNWRVEVGLHVKRRSYRPNRGAAGGQPPPMSDGLRWEGRQIDPRNVAIGGQAALPERTRQGVGPRKL